MRYVKVFLWNYVCAPLKNDIAISIHRRKCTNRAESFQNHSAFSKILSIVPIDIGSLQNEENLHLCNLIRVLTDIKIERERLLIIYCMAQTRQETHIKLYAQLHHIRSYLRY